jgi:AcrR family transcriptional regulator
MNRTPERTRPPAEFRRGSTEVRNLLLDAARSLFAARGYAGATTHDIACEAGVSEALVFRHFGTKAHLFERAVIDPINEFVSGYVEQWTARPRGEHTVERVAFAYVDGFYRLLLDWSRHQRPLGEEHGATYRPRRIQRGPGRGGRLQLRRGLRR